MEEIIKYIDFNIDLGQIDSITNTDFALDLIEYVSSVNIACGFNSENPLLIKKAIEHCKFKEKVIGAHISLPKYVENPLSLSDEEIEAIVLYQLGSLASFAKAYSLNVEYVRPHGAMYVAACENLDFSVAVANAIKKFSKWFVLYGAAGSVLKETAAQTNIPIAQEVLLNLPYKTGAVPDFKADRQTETGKSLIRLRRLSNLSEIEVSENLYEKVDFNTVHFSASDSNVAELLQEANTIFKPRPVNYNNVVESGWV